MSLSLYRESDSENDNPHSSDARTQLILGNSKGPGQLSYRRIIYGPDGRIKQQYSEKSKIGYGIFSYTDVMKPSDYDDHSKRFPHV